MPQFLRDLYQPREMQGIHLEDVYIALRDDKVRGKWLIEVFDEVKRLNMEVDRCLERKLPMNFEELSAKRRALSWVLNQAILSRSAVERETRQNP